MTTTTLTGTTAPTTSAPTWSSRTGRNRISWPATIILIVGALYCLLPVAWVLMASSKSAGELFSTFTFAPSTHLLDNIGELTSYRDGVFWRWMANTALYAGVGGLA